MDSSVARVVAHEFAVFLEGIKIPVLGFDVHFASESSFNINVPPVNEFNDIKPNTYGLIVYRENKASNKWHLLAEGVYMGPSYSKTPGARTLRLKFRDMQWFLESAKVYNLITSGSPMERETFALLEAAFLGDARYKDAVAEGTNVEASTQLTARFNFLNAIQEFGKNDDLSPLSKPLEALWALLARTNDFFGAHAKGLKLNEDRVHIIDNKKMGNIFKGYLIEAFTRVLGEFTHQTTVMDLMFMLMQIIQYDFFPIPGMATSSGSSIRSYVSKPIMHLVAPPACNVVFPDEVAVFNYELNFGSRPTRLWFRESLDSFGTTRGYFAPKELEEEINGDTIKLLEEERLRGINPQIVKLPWAYTRGISTPLDEQRYSEMVKSRDEYNAAFASYLYYDQKYASTPMNLQMAFSPRILPGFPMLILDPIMPMIGSVISVGHYIDIESGTAHTGITLSHVRPAKDKVPILSGWYDEDTFSPENIDSVYRQFGTRAFYGPEGLDQPAVDEDGMIDLFPAVKSIHERYEETRGVSKMFYGRDMPSFWVDGEGGGDIADALGITWVDDKLEAKPGEDSPFTISYEGSETTTSIRRGVIESLRSKIIQGDGAGVWKRDIEEGGMI